MHLISMSDKVEQLSRNEGARPEVALFSKVAGRTQTSATLSYLKRQWVRPNQHQCCTFTYVAVLASSVSFPVPQHFTWNKNTFEQTRERRTSGATPSEPPAVSSRSSNSDLLRHHVNMAPHRLESCHGRPALPSCPWLYSHLPSPGFGFAVSPSLPLTCLCCGMDLRRIPDS